MKKILLLGGTGAMGSYLAPELIKMGYRVDVVALDSRESDNPNLTYTQADCMDNELLAELLKNDYDAIVDFLIYKNVSDTFGSRMSMMLENTGHYIYLSSYRVYANEQSPITESAPRLLDVSPDKDYIAEKETEYSLYKAVGEDMLLASKYKNWTAVRPAITYSSRKFQLITLEAPILVHRIMNNKTVILPEEAMNVQATMTWGGDVAKMIARLIFNKQAYGEMYTTSTSEHHTWGEIADIYSEVGGMKYITTDTDSYLKVTSPDSTLGMWQLKYDRLFDRIVDNSKILNITGMKQSELMTLKDGLKTELATVPQGYVWPETKVNALMDDFVSRLGG